MRFYGSTDLDYVGCGQPSHLDLDPQTDFTLSCWVQTENNVGYGTFIGKAGATTASRQYQLTYGSPGPPYELQAVIGGTFYASGAKGADGAWHHCGLINFDNAGTQNFRMYLDGVAVGVNAVSGSATNTADLLLGARRGDDSNGGASFVMRGTLADIRIYNRALAAPEMLTIFNQRGRDNIVEGLVGRWLMNEESPGTAASGAGIVKDLSTYGTHGTPSDAPDYAEDVITFKRRRAFGN